MFAMLRSSSVLGILGLGMAVVVIGRGVDLSMVALLAVPTGVILTLAGAGYGIGISLAAGFALAVLVGVLNGIMVAYAEIPSLFVTLATGIGLAGLGQSGLFQYDIVPWPHALDSIGWIGRGSLVGIPHVVQIGRASYRERVCQYV